MAFFEVMCQYLQARWVKCAWVALIVIGVVLLTVASAQAMGPGVVASHHKASSVAAGRCYYEQQHFGEGIVTARCHSFDASCHIPRYNHQIVFCIAFFWLEHKLNTIIAEPEWEFWSRALYYKRGRYGKPQLIRPRYEWEHSFMNYGPPNNAIRINR